MARLPAGVCRFRVSLRMGIGLLFGLIGVWSAWCPPAVGQQERSTTELSPDAPDANPTAVKGAEIALRNFVRKQLKAMGHRNWIAVVDAAYPLQKGIKTVDTVGMDHLAVVRLVLQELQAAPHVSGAIHVDQELEYVDPQDAPGIDEYRRQLAELLAGRQISKLLHEDIITNLDEAAETFEILILKTDMVMPYTSVFIRLECGYWNGDAEQRLRARMPSPP